MGSNNLSTTFAGLIQDGGQSNSAGGSLVKTGSGTLVLSGANAYTGGTVVQAGRLLVANSAGSGTSGGTVTVNNNGSVLGGTGTISAPVIINAGAALSGGDPMTASGSLKLANALTLNGGSAIELGLGPSGAHSSISRLGGAWTFAGNQSFSFVDRGAQPGFYDNIITGLPGDPGGTASWIIGTPGFAGFFTYDGAGNIDLTVTGVPSSLRNISTRVRVQGADNVLIGGMIATGTVPKKVIIRAIGPTLTDLGVADALQNPTLELFQGNNLLFSNDDWRASTQQGEIAVSGLAPNKDAESAIIWTLIPGQNYTAVVRGKDDQSGVGLVEAFDLEPRPDSRLANISTRGFVDVDDNAMIAGLIVGPSSGGSSLKVLVRALGPTLSDFGVAGILADPTVDLVNASGTVIRSNNNWMSSQQAEIEAAQLAPTYAKEAALVESLLPGPYTAIVRGVARTTGVGLVEVYNIP